MMESERELVMFHQQLWGINADSPLNPAPNPVSMARDDIARVVFGKYAVAEKNDGERRTCLLAEAAGEERCALFSRSMQDARPTLAGRRPINVARLTMLCGKLAAALGASPRDLDVFAGTLLDGELVAGQEYVVFDAHTCCGYAVWSWPLMRRVGAARMVVDIFAEMYLLAMAGAPLKVRVKEWRVPVTAEALRSLRLLPQADGLVFTPLAGPLVRNRAHDVFKWKPAARQTVDLRFTDAGFAWAEQGADAPVAGVTVEATGDLSAGTVYELAPSAGGGSWSVVRARPDKGYPNDKHTVEATLAHFQENVTIDELAQAFG